jgi:hypothetical protein
MTSTNQQTVLDMMTRNRPLHYGQQAVLLLQKQCSIKTDVVYRHCNDNGIPNQLMVKF